MLVMNHYFIFGLLLVLTIATASMELSDRKKIPDLPDCSYVTNYCTNYGKNQGLKYIVREPTQAETPEILLSKIETDCCRLSNTVYWRMSLLVALIIVIMIWIFNYLGNVKLSATTYLFMGVVIWFFNYWMRNYLDFHYHNHMCKRVQESVERLRKML